MTRLIVSALLAPAVLALGAGAAAACSCVPFPDAAAHLARTDVVFEGRALGGQSLGQRRGATRFEVVEPLKGGAAGTVSVRHPTGDSAGCGVAFKTGKTYLVFANRDDDGELTTSLCAMARFPEADYRSALTR